MPENKKDVFKILAEMRRTVLGISDTNPKGIEGFLASFLPVGEPVNPDDFRKPWKPNMTSPNKPKPPSATGADPATTDDTSEIGKAYENLSNTCTLVDYKIRLNQVYQALQTNSTISQSWEVIINGANIMPLPPEQEEFQKKQRDKFFPRLRKTVKDEDGQDMEVDTKEYKAYKEFEKKYHVAVRNYATNYMVNMSVKATAQMWGAIGKTYVNEVNDAWDEWMTLGFKQFIEEARDNLSAMGTDCTAHMIATAKKKFEAYRIATQGAIPVTSQYVELFPSNWCETNVENDGWTEYSYNWKKETTVTDEETTSFNAEGGFDIGFWSAKANVSHEHAEQHKDFTSDGLEISFKYALIEINRPWLDTILFDLGNWFLIGNYPKGCISNGNMNQVLPIDNTAATWLPIIPKQIIVIKDLFIKTDHIHDHFDAMQQSSSGGGSIGYGPWNLKANYKHGKKTSTQTAEKEGEGLRVKGVQIIGWISHLVNMSPKLDPPKDQKEDTFIK